jgi:hypothetical protein
MPALFAQSAALKGAITDAEHSQIYSTSYQIRLFFKGFTINSCAVLLKISLSLSLAGWLARSLTRSASVAERDSVHTRALVMILSLSSREPSQVLFDIKRERDAHTSIS